MHQIMKKVWAVLMVLCLIVGILPLTANAALVDADEYVTQQLSLGEDLVLHLRASLPESAASIAQDAVGTLTYAGNTKTYTIDDMTPDENGMYDMAVEMAVAEMTEDIHAVVNAKVLGVNQEIISEHYSIRAYLDSIINGDYSQTTKDLCLELLNMGAWAQLYFNYNISNLANAGYDTSASNAVPEECPTLQIKGDVDGIKFHGASVRFLSKTAVRFYFEADGAVDGYTFTIDGKTYEPKEKDGKYYIETPGINPQNMSDEINVSVTDGNNTVSVGYAPIWYFIRTYNKSDDEYTKALMEAAYSYYKEAENYKTQICMDLDISTLSGDFESIGLGFYPLDFEGDINTYTDRIEVPTGTTYTVKLDQGKYLVDGEFKGIGITVLGGPTWDAVLDDGTTPDRHNIAVSNLRLEGPEDRSINLTLATIASGTEGTGYTNANAGGTATLADGVITFANGFFTDGYKITFNEADTYLCLDMNITTLGNSTDKIEVRFYPHGFEDTFADDWTDKLTLTAGTTNSVYLDAAKYLVDGEIPGIGIGIFGGPAWDTQLEDGTYDRHNFTISNIRLEGENELTYDLSRASVKTGFASSNSGGIATVADGIVSVTGGYLYDGHMITFVDETIPEETEPEVTEPEVTEPEVTEPEVTEPEEFDTTLSLDVKLDTVTGTWENEIEIRFYAYNFEGNAHDSYTDSVMFKVGEQQTVKLNAEKYMVNGELTGIGIGVFGGPLWNTQISDGVYDRHTVTISNVYLEGEQSKSFDLNKSTVASGTDGTGFTGDVFGPGVVTIGDSIVLSDGFQYFAHKISLVEDTNTYVTMDMQIDTLGGDWANDIEIRFYPYSFEGNPHETYTDKVIFKAGEKQTVKLNAENYLVDGKLTGIGIGVFGGPLWNTQISDGVYDRHTVTISNVYLEGEQSKSFDLNKSTVASGTDGTGFTGDVFGPGEVTIGDSIVLSDGFQYFAHKISLVEDTNTYVTMDMQIDTLGGDWANDIEIRFYPYSFEGNPHVVYTDNVIFKAGEKQTVKLKADEYLVDGKLTGIGIGIFGGPAWDAKLPDGYTPDRHTVTISNVQLTGGQSVAYDLSKSTMISGTGDTGYTEANGSGVGAFVDGVYKITNGFCYDCHKISLAEDTNTYVTMDMQIDTLGGDWANDIEIRFYPYSFEGNPHETYTDKVIFKAGKKQTVKLNAENYLVDGKLTGIGIGIFGGPEWNTQISDGVYDRHTVTVSSIQLTGSQSVAYDLSKSTMTSGTADTGYTVANGSGVGAFVNGVYKITNGFCYDCHKLSLTEGGESETPEEQNTYICMDMLFTTLGGSTSPVEIGFYPSNFEGDINNWTDKLTITAGTTANIQLDAEKYMVDGQVSGIGFAIFGGPAWDAKLPDGYTPDRHTLTISNARLEGAEAKAFDLSQSTWANGNNGTGFTNANGSGAATMGQEIVITNGFQYDGHKITLVEDTSTYIEMDLLLTTLGNSTDPVEIRFCNYGQADSVHTTYTNKLQVTAGTKTSVRFKVDEYLVNGELPGFGIAIFGGPEWNTQLEDGTYDRHSVVISNLRLTGVDARDIDLSTATVSVGIPGSNTGGQIAILDGQIVISGGFRYDGHLITF